MKYVTIKDVAKKVNVSVSTVSRAFNEKYDIKRETKELILRTAREMGYRPNPMAKKLIQQRSFNIGIVVPEFVNSYFPEVIIGIQEVLFEKGYQVLITQSNKSFETELKNVTTLENNMVDGIIISTTSDSEVNNPYYQKLIDSGFPMVFFNRVNSKIENISKILFNDYKWAFFATEHLINQGCKKIVHLRGTKSLTLSNERARGFINALEKHKIEYSEDQIISTGFSLEDGVKAAESLVEKNLIPDAVFAVNDAAAIGAMKTFRKNGYSIPNDIAFVGFTETKMSSYMDPALTSVNQPKYEIGKEAALMLIEQIENPKSYKPQTLVLNGSLNIRESSVKI